MVVVELFSVFSGLQILGFPSLGLLVDDIFFCFCGLEWKQTDRPETRLRVKEKLSQETVTCQIG